MPKYISDVPRWLSHECRAVKAGEEFSTEFPLAPNGKPMTLGDTLHLVEDKAKSKAKPADAAE
jgi:hypothetical protein